MFHFEQILEATSDTTAAVRPPTSFLYYHPKTDNTCVTLLEKQGRTHKRLSLMHVA